MSLSADVFNYGFGGGFGGPVDQRATELELVKKAIPGYKADAINKLIVPSLPNQAVVRGWSRMHVWGGILSIAVATTGLLLLALKIATVAGIALTAGGLVLAFLALAGAAVVISAPEDEKKHVEMTAFKRSVRLSEAYVAQKQKEEEARLAAASRSYASRILGLASGALGWISNKF